MKRVKTVNQVGVRQSLLLAGLILASAGAQAAATHTVTVTGVIGSSLEGGPLAYDTSSWLNKAYTLEMTVDASNTVRQHAEMDDIPGEYENDWRPVQLSYRLAIAGVPGFSGADNQFSSLETLNDVTVPAGLSGLPAGIVVGQTYDLYSIGGSDIGLGCFSGGANNVCGDVGDTWEGAGFLFDYFWDVAQHNAIGDDNLPSLADPAMDFTQGFGNVDIDFWHATLGTNGQYTGVSVAWLQAGVTSVTVTAVPEPETYAMLLAGLGLVGFAARRRAAR
ncbi:MAG: FxDxF family PEP-CTERM protein [Deltaproteobacteria bacterium]|nr:FxDxF family PEP-CTERM protein [Deltaproteobacteria bacterium]